MPALVELDPAGTEQALVRLGGRPFHARIARRELFQRGITSWSAMTGLPLALRERLEQELPLLGGQELERRRAADGAVKLLLGFGPGPRGPIAVETVHIPSSRAGRGATLCVSTQAGCPVGCPFCASGLAGLERNLASHEILEQFVRGRALGELSRSVVMGMGEPLLNLANLEAALAVVRDEMGLGARSITVSTVGFPDRLRRAAESGPRFQLAISLHSPDQEQRDRLVPAMAGVPIAEVLAAGDHWFETTGREVTYEYALLGGENADPETAGRLAAFLAGRRATVNLIPYNPVEGTPWRRPTAEEVARFHQRLVESGVVATVRWSRGLEADAACGQLRLRARAGSGATQ